MSEVFRVLLNSALAVSIPILTVLLLRCLLRRAPKWISCLLWGAIGLRLLCPILPESTISLVPSAEIFQKNIELSPSPVLDSGIPLLNEWIAPLMTEALMPTPWESVNPLQILFAVGAIIWMLGCFGMLLFALISSLCLRHRLRPSLPLKDGVFLCDSIETPFIFGMIRPRIYLPSGLSEQDIPHVLLHERAHLRRLDHLLKPLGFILLSVYWFHPFLWLAYSLFCRDIEAACDQRAIHGLRAEQRREYAHALLNCSTHRRTVLSCPVAFGEIGVKERIKNVMNYKKASIPLVCVALLLALCTSACIVVNPKTEPPTLANGEVCGENAKGHRIFLAEVLSLREKSCLVAPHPDADESRSSDKISVSFPDGGIPDGIQVGDWIAIEYDGLIAESYPAQIFGTFSIMPASMLVTK